MMERIFKWLNFNSRVKVTYKHKVVSELPDQLKHNTVYIEANQGFPWQAVMICPCGCKSTLHMNLIEEYKPHWKFYIDNKKRFSLSPSIHRTVGCKSHFFLKKGAIFWCS
jgi:hypothetical protein